MHAQKKPKKKKPKSFVFCVFFSRSGLTHRPSSSVRGHVAVDLEARRVVNGKHGVDAVLSLTTGVQIAAVAGARALEGVRGRTH